MQICEGSFAEMGKLIATSRNIISLFLLGLQSIADVHNSIARGDFTCGIAAGVESMSLDKWVQDSELTQKHVQVHMAHTT